MSAWFSIEITHGASSASSWMDAHGDQIVTSALGEGATDWQWFRYRWGVVLEVEFVDESEFERFRAIPAVTSAFENVPDPVNGFVVRSGRRGSAGTRVPVRPRPLAGSGAAALPLPIYLFDDEELGIGGVFPQSWVNRSVQTA